MSVVAGALWTFYHAQEQNLLPADMTQPSLEKDLIFYHIVVRYGKFWTSIFGTCCSL